MCSVGEGHAIQEHQLLQNGLARIRFLGHRDLQTVLETLIGHDFVEMHRGTSAWRDHAFSDDPRAILHPTKRLNNRWQRIGMRRMLAERTIGNRRVGIAHL